MRFGCLSIASRAFLAPMVGVTDAGMRAAASAWGAGLTFSEMIDADYIDAEDAAARAKLAARGERPFIVQIAARSVAAAERAARTAAEAGADALDINMGCPAKKVVGGYAGAAIMREPELASALARTVAAAQLPFSVKMRLGWDDASKNAPEIARRVADCGAHFVTVHGRTRNQFYKGAADWRAIAAVRAAISIPLVANGDCASLADAREMLALSGADAVMIGRAAIGRPWLVGEIGAGLSGNEAWRAPGPAEKQRAALAHFDHLIAAFGLDRGVRHARKHLAAYADFAAADGCGLGPQQRAALTRTQDAAEARDLLAACWIEQRNAA